MTNTIYYDAAPKHEDTKIIWEGISDYAKKTQGFSPGKSFAFFIKNELYNIKGGCSGYIYYGCLYVDLLWVDETLRGRKYGTQLMNNAEKLARDNHCNFIAVNTMNFEALEFYRKLGFTVEFERRGFDKNSSMIFLRKDLKLFDNSAKKSGDIIFNDIKLIPASLKDYPTIQNMARFYVYDMSQYLGNEEGWECPEDGLYECIDFKKYWQTDDAFPFLIQYRSELVGFVIIDKKGSEPTIDFNVAQFFILRKFKSRGIGKYVACQCFDKFPGIWEVMVIPGNDGAYQFWRSVINEYTNNKFIEYTRNIKHLDNSSKNIFCFSNDG